MTKGSEEYHKEKLPIVVAEDEGKVVENEPIRRPGVVHSDDVYEEGEFVQRGTTKSLLNRWTNPVSDQPVTQRRPIVVAEDEGRILESEPARRTDVVHADEFESEADVVQKGTTKSLLSQWKCKGTEEFKTERKVINIAEAEGKVAENEPLRRSDVVHADDVQQDQVQRGMAKSLMTEWSKKGTEEFIVERKPIILAEAEGKVAENEPLRRSDVVHADDVQQDQVQRGMAKSLMTEWSKKGTEEFIVERKPIILAEAEGKVAENEPLRRSDVVHSDDVQQDQVQRGIAKSLMTEWSKKGTEEFIVERKPIILAEAEGKVAENEPLRRCDVVHSDDVQQDQVQRGMARSLMTEWSKKGTEEFIVERKPIILAEAEGKVAESEPIRRDDVIHHDDLDTAGESVSKGLTKNLLSQWTVKGSEEFVAEKKPIVVAEVEGQVVENEPTVRTDVVHSDEISTEGETIRRGTTKTLLTQWKTKGTEEYKPQRKSIIIEDKLPTS